jgi:hypothetical protein
MSKSTFTVDGVDLVDGTVTQTVNPIEVTTNLPSADPNWTFVDTNGHAHYYDNGYPTLEWVATGSWWCIDCQEDHEDGEYRCILCGEKVKPGITGPSKTREFIAGTKEVTATFVSFTPLDDVSPGTLYGKSGRWHKVSESFADRRFTTELHWEPAPRKARSKP